MPAFIFYITDPHPGPRRSGAGFPPGGKLKGGYFKIKWGRRKEPMPGVNLKPAIVESV
jgi:hypothetical protein